MYTYFANNFGFVESLPDNTLVDKYKNHSIKELKKALKLLKLTDSDLVEIKYVSRLMRNKFKTNPNNNLDNNFPIALTNRLITTTNTLNVISGDM